MGEPQAGKLHQLVMPDGAVLPYLYGNRDGIEVEVERDAEGYVPEDWAVVTITDYANLLVYGVTAKEDAQGRARLIALGITVMDDPDDLKTQNPVGFLGDHPERSRAWLARVAIECARGSVIVAETDETARLRQIAETVQRCEREGISATTVLAQSLRIGKRTVSRRIEDAVQAGFLPPRRPGRPSKPTTPKESA